ncbi:hemagglutinin repeat-containing protein [Ochrobactrum sp. BTU1]|nr:hemagglutinin repeat-containing protein [Ochrobactrum sp. BTU1]
MALDAARDVNILPGAESCASEDKEKRSGFGVQVKSSEGSASIGIGFGSSKDQTKQGAETNAVSSLQAGDNVIINAGRDANLQAALVEAENDVAITAERDVNLLAAQDKTNYEHMHEELFGGITAKGESETGKALSAVSPGEIINNNLDSQQQNVDDLRRDTTDTNTSLPGIPDLQKLLSEQLKAQQLYDDAAAKAAKMIDDYADGKSTYVRVYTEGKTDQGGQWIMTLDYNKGLSPQQIADKFDLPLIPLHITVETPPEGTIIRTGTVNSGNFGGSGGGTQFELLTRFPDTAFNNPVKLP